MIKRMICRFKDHIWQPPKNGRRSHCKRCQIERVILHDPMGEAYHTVFIYPEEKDYNG